MDRRILEQADVNIVTTPARVPLTMWNVRQPPGRPFEAATRLVGRAFADLRSAMLGLGSATQAFLAAAKCVE